MMRFFNGSISSEMKALSYVEVTNVSRFEFERKLCNADLLYIDPQATGMNMRQDGRSAP